MPAQSATNDHFANGSSPSEVPTVGAPERLRLRYPRSRLPRPVLVVAVVVLAAVFLAWVIWTAVVQANPVASGQVSAYQVLSDREIAVTVTVERPDPSIAVVCNVVAQAADFQSVGAIERLEVPPRPERVVDITTTVKTLRRATSVSVRSCSLP